MLRAPCHLEVVRTPLILVALLCGAARADADPEVTPDPARCEKGAAFAKRGDLPRAALYLEGCGGAERDVKKKLDASDLSRLEIVTRPEGLPVELDAMPGETITGGTTVWVKAGTHTVTATIDGTKLQATSTVQPFARGAVILDATLLKKEPPKPKDQVMNFDEDNAHERNDGPPPDVKRRTMISDKLLGVTGPAGPEIADPLATPTHAAPLPLWLGVRLGGGVFDDAAAAARVRPSVGAAARILLGDRGPAFVAARLDWSRRGGQSDSAVDVLGASAGAGYSVVDADAIGVALIAQLRGDLRFADTRNAMSVSRGGASAAAEIEIAFPATPLTAGLRFEQGLTELVPGARDRALVLELGVDWR